MADFILSSLNALARKTGYINIKIKIGDVRKFAVVSPNDVYSNLSRCHLLRVEHKKIGCFGFFDVRKQKKMLLFIAS